MLLRLRWALTCALFTLCLAPLHKARAQNQQRVVFESCPELNEPSTRKLLALELGNLADRSSVLVRCEGGNVRLSVALGERQGSRLLELGATDKRAWPRLIALSAVELLTEPIVVAEATPRATAAVDDQQTTAATTATERAVRPDEAVAFGLLAGPLVRAMPKVGTMVMGVQVGGLGVWAEPLGRMRLGLRVDAAFERGQRTLDAGDGTTSAISGALALVLIRPGRWAPWTSVGVRGGRAWLQGTPQAIATGLSFAAPWFGPELALGLDWRRTRHFGASAHLDAGYAAVSAVGFGATPTSPRFGYDGAWFALNISLALQL